MATNETKTSGIAEEFEGAELGDERRSRRLVRMAQALSEEPAASFPEAMKDEAGLEGAYRFLGNEKVDPQAILAPHFGRTCARAAYRKTILALHDTTQFGFGGDSPRQGLGRLRDEKSQGFFAHICLAVSGGDHNDPLGVMAFNPFFRSGPPKGYRTAKERESDPANESRRWEAGVEEVEERLGEKCSAIHVMDREGDSYALFSALVEKGRRFVIRLCHDRALALPPLVEGKRARPKISDAIGEAKSVLTREVKLSRRKKPAAPRAGKIHPQRDSRKALLHFSATGLELRRPSPLKDSLPESLRLNVVHIKEDASTAAEFEPVEWTLLTSEPIGTVEEIEQVVDIYRARWTIEEYFKALKTGCAYEKRQLESSDSLLNALAIFIPIAWKLLQLRSLARSEPDAPADAVLTPLQLSVLRTTTKAKLSPQPTVREAMLAVASLGGHLKRNGDPGWQVLGRGLEKLLAYEEGWRAATQARCDQ